MRSIELLNELNSNIYNMLKSIEISERNSDKYLLSSIRALACIANSVINSVSHNLHDKYRTYTATAMTRLLMELVADIAYLKSHRDQAKKFWCSQDKIREDMNNTLKNGDDRWNLYIAGSINHHGELDDGTVARVKQSLGNDSLGQYNFLNFYSHSNIAGYLNMIQEKTTPPGLIIRFTASIFYMTAERFIEELHATDGISFNKNTLLSRLGLAQRAYFSSEIGFS